MRGLVKEAEGQEGSDSQRENPHGGGAGGDLFLEEEEDQSLDRKGEKSTHSRSQKDTAGGCQDLPNKFSSVRRGGGGFAA